MPRRDSWPATILFSTKELKTYDIWRSQYLLEKPHDRLPTAFEYEDYLDWWYHVQIRSSATISVASNNAKEKQSDPAYEGFTLAAKCKHPLHPAHPAVHTRTNEDEGGEEKDDDGNVVEIPLRCPKCILTAHVRLLNALKDKWEECGAPWHSKGGLGESYVEMMKVYHHIKVPLVNTVDQFREWAELEVAWEIVHPDRDIEVAREFSAKRTVEAYVKFSICACPQVDDENWKMMQDAQEKLKGIKDPSIPPPPQLSLSFTPETPDGSHRNSIFYRKPYEAKPYNLGPHACPTPEGWAETSFLYSHRYTIAQSRILLVEGFTKRPYITYRNLNCGPSFGDNKHVDRLIDMVDDWLNSLHKDDQRTCQNDLAMRTSYIWVVKKERAPNEAEDRDGDEDADEEERSPEAFTQFWFFKSLLGTELESWARYVGDVTEEEEEEWRKEQDKAWVQKEEEGAEVSLASDNSSEEGVYGESDDGREVGEEEDEEDEEEDGEDGEDSEESSSSEGRIRTPCLKN